MGRFDDENIQAYYIGQYELHVSTYKVEATSIAQAIKRVLDGDQEAEHISVDYSNTVDDLGISATEDPDLTRELRELGVEIEGDVVPSIASVHPVDKR